MTYFVVFAVLLVLANFLLVWNFRQSKTFAIYPGIIQVLLLIVMGGYLLNIVFITSPVPLDAGKGKSSKLLINKPELERQIMATEARRPVAKIEGFISTCRFLVGLILFQSLLATIAAVVGWRVVSIRKKYYTGFIVLHVFVMCLAGTTEWLLYNSFPV